MSAEEKIRRWGENDSVIMCVLVDSKIAGARCELCLRGIAALPESQLKACQPGWHLICKECVNLVRSQGHEMKWLGRYSTAEQARKVLPE
jgi:hypothetical protein